MSQESISYLEASSRIPLVERSYDEVAKELFSPIIYSPNSSPRSIPSPTVPVSYFRAPLGKFLSSFLQ
ncbi:unnamed protein product [Euphydryas editha]|uniref:Uncharacterized protein n=1 Tax=Euphydryas editha TaxID=104508 RepID=A0AAU9TCI6_EUPED|nr:unnamed protein product [Euphydryas editha]